MLVNNLTNVYNDTYTTIADAVMSTTSINDGPLVDSDAVSPVTLSMEWSRVARLLIMIGLSVIGSIGNVYMISSVMIEDHLNKRGKYIQNIICTRYNILIPDGVLWYIEQWIYVMWYTTKIKQKILADVKI